ncbi:hypothetical protein Glove_196g72 [Diversispora epigaea]|uniref:Uncharacterized protein n=1 Tax=Diversispora epigaea TaxID=1348612 RepID=A0A397IS40_9GLOM|nr:hypothetical protein Glove_196g72 [Diversispora epigaea]
MPNISDEIFDIIIKYIYGGFVNVEKVETKFIFDLMMAANKFEIEELTKKLENHLIETKNSWLKSHFSLVYRSIFNGSNFKYLEKFCNDIVAKYPSLIFDAEDFTSLQESALVSLLKRDDLQLEEVIIWDYITKWGIAQNSALPVPYKKILDEQLWDDLTQYFIDQDKPMESIILPPRTILVQELPIRTTKPINPFSTIITYEHVAEISSWIDRKSSTYSLTSIPYDTVVIMKVKGTEEILGGYNRLIWDIMWDTNNIKKRDRAIENTHGLPFGDILHMYSPSSNFSLNNYCGCTIYEKPIKTTIDKFSIVD